jgi:hypothetical protein
MSAYGPKQTWLVHRTCLLSGVKQTWPFAGYAFAVAIWGSAKGDIAQPSAVSRTHIRATLS